VHSPPRCCRAPAPSNRSIAQLRNAALTPDTALGRSCAIAYYLCSPRRREGEGLPRSCRSAQGVLDEVVPNGTGRACGSVPAHGGEGELAGRGLGGHSRSGGTDCGAACRGFAEGARRSSRVQECEGERERPCRRASGLRARCWQRSGSPWCLSSLTLACPTRALQQTARVIPRDQALAAVEQLHRN